MSIREVPIVAVPLSRFDPLIGPERATLLHQTAERARERLLGRTVWNINSTAAGGGVAEMLSPLLAYTRGAGVDARWLVIAGDEEFFRITKRLHHRFHGAPGDGGPLGAPERAHYEAVLARNAVGPLGLVEEGDIVFLHDPQTAGLIHPLRQVGAIVVWRLHIGSDERNAHTQEAWRFVRPYINDATCIVVSRAAYAPTGFRPPVRVIAPSIDPFAVKNADMPLESARAVLAHVGIIGAPETGPVVFHRRDGTSSRMAHVADIVRAGPAPTPDVPLVAQVSRWDRLKDMVGVMRGFAGAIERLGHAQLALVGPSVSGVADDPEGAMVLGECIEVWRSLPPAHRRHIQLVCVPMDDLEENAAVINALQRHASVVVQKSLAEGFGLTVAEAMWKARPVIASAVGGIREQIVDGESGLLLEDPTDLVDFGAALEKMLGDPEFAARLGANARRHALEHLIGSRHLVQTATLLIELSEPPVREVHPVPRPHLEPGEPPSVP